MYVRMKIFGVKHKYVGEFYKVDMPFAILILQDTHVNILTFVLKLLPIFYIWTCIENFKGRSHESLPMAIFSVVVVGVRYHYKSVNNEEFCQMIITNGILEEDHVIVGFSQSFHDEYAKIKETFDIGENMLVMFKNITTTSKYD